MAVKVALVLGQPGVAGHAAHRIDARPPSNAARPRSSPAQRLQAATAPAKQNRPAGEPLQMVTVARLLRQLVVQHVENCNSVRTAVEFACVDASEPDPRSQESLVHPLLGSRRRGRKDIRQRGSLEGRDPSAAASNASATTDLASFSARFKFDLPTGRSKTVTAMAKLLMGLMHYLSGYS